jgi:hypothetical protein
MIAIKRKEKLSMKKWKKMSINLPKISPRSLSSKDFGLLQPAYIKPKSQCWRNINLQVRKEAKAYSFASRFTSK